MDLSFCLWTANRDGKVCVAKCPAYMNISGNEPACFNWLPKPLDDLRVRLRVGQRMDVNITVAEGTFDYGEQTCNENTEKNEK